MLIIAKPGAPRSIQTYNNIKGVKGKYFGQKSEFFIPYIFSFIFEGRMRETPDTIIYFISLIFRRDKKYPTRP